MNTKRRRVLIIDDEMSFTRLLQLNLHHTGRYTAEVVNDARKAVAVARQFDPDIILLDVMMPGMDGGDVALRLQATPQLKGKPIIFLTAAVKPNEVSSHAGFLGGLPFIAKPLDFHEVLDCIEKKIGKGIPAYMETKPSAAWG
jgi:CheY-like chemotaxis protein